MARRRALIGHPLLLASGGALVWVGCGHHKGPPDGPVGNLMAPATLTAEVCVDVSPPEARANAQIIVGDVVTHERCATIEGEIGYPVQIHVLSPGYVSQHLDTAFAATIPAFAVEMVEGEDPPLDVPDILPVGNLMQPR